MFELPDIVLTLPEIEGLEDLGFTVKKDNVEPTEETVWHRPVVFQPKRVAFEYAQEFADKVVLDGKTETFAFVSGNFVFGDFIEALVYSGRLSVKRMSIMTLSMNDENIDSIRNILEWQPVERLDIVLSDYWYSHENKLDGLVKYLFDELDIDGLDLHVGFAGVHCKTFVIETCNGNFLTIHGSANLRSSGNVEQVHISPDPALAGFCSDMTRQIINTYDVVNQDRRKKKSIRRAGLWQVVAAAAAAEKEEAEAVVEAARETDVRTSRKRQRNQPETC